MFWFTCLICIVTTQAVVLGKPQLRAFSDELIRYVNEQPGALWKAGPAKRFDNLEQVKSLLGALTESPEQRNYRRPTLTHNLYKYTLPKAFDARERWPYCPSIPKIRDQSSCGSCWAFAATGAMADRICIHSGGRQKVELSVRDPLSCCKNCGSGCNGGYPGEIWDYWRDHGIVTGGSLENPTGCQPYPFPKCDHDTNSSALPLCPTKLYPTPKCETKCQPGYNKTYAEDKYYGNSSYNVESNAEQIMHELMINGPLAAVFYIYEDFVHYQSGIYQYVTGTLIGGHAIRIIGWGEQNGVPYWLLANSWNEEWGEKGYFRVLRGNDECGIESRVNAGMPRI